MNICINILLLVNYPIEESITNTENEKPLKSHVIFLQKSY